MRVAIVNLNLDAAETAGCRQIASALHALSPRAQPELVHFPHAFANDSVLAGADAVVLGPQGTPFSSYSGAFFPDLRRAAERFDGPLLAICGGMQALGMALGGQLGTVDGGSQIAEGSYAGRAKITGNVAIEVWRDRVPEWLAKHWALPADPQPCAQSHCEQLTALAAPLVAIARSAQTPIEAWAHASKPWLGTQFHPERGWDHGTLADGGGGAGQLWLRAWLAAAARPI